MPGQGIALEMKRSSGSLRPHASHPTRRRRLDHGRRHRRADAQCAGPRSWRPDDLLPRTHRKRAPRGAGACRSRHRPGRSCGPLAAQRAGLSDPLSRLRAAGRHRRGGEHPLPRGRGRRRRRPLRRQGAGLRPRLPANRFPVDPCRHRAGSARQARGHRHRRRRACFRAVRHRTAAARTLRTPAVPSASRSEQRQGQCPLQHLHDLGHDQCAQVRPASPGGDRRPRAAGGSRLRPHHARNAVALDPALVRRLWLRPDDGDAGCRQALRAGRILRDRRDRHG